MPNTKNRGKNYLYLLLTHTNGGQFVKECIVEDYSIYEHEKCCCEALESIALEGAMIAHWLNVESDKLINIIHSSNNEWEINATITLLCKLIDSAANREIKLTDKLQKLMQHCDFCNEMCSQEDDD